MKADEIFDALESAIVSGAVAPGSLLRQEHLAKDFGVSRTPIREVLLRLDAAGLVSLEANRGARVRLLAPDDVRDAFVVRAELEGRAAELAAERASQEQLDRMLEAERRFDALSDELRAGLEREQLWDVMRAWVEANDMFHDAVLEASGVALLADSAQSCRRGFAGPLLARWSPELEARLILNAKQHRIIRQMLELGSGAAARAAMRDHIQSAASLMETTLFSDAPAEATFTTQTTQPEEVEPT